MTIFTATAGRRTTANGTSHYASVVLPTGKRITRRVTPVNQSGRAFHEAVRESGIEDYQRGTKVELTEVAGMRLALALMVVPVGRRFDDEACVIGFRVRNLDEAGVRHWYQTTLTGGRRALAALAR